LQDQKLQEAKEREEDEERKRYLGLSDREKVNNLFDDDIIIIKEINK